MRLAEGNRPDLKQMAARIIDLLEPELAADGFDLLDVRVFRGGGRLQLRIFVDLLEGGISLDQVASASRTVGMLLEEADPFPGQYVIEVSSPGIRRPLRKLEHYQAAVGQKVDLKVPGQGSGASGGVLQAVEGDHAGGRDREPDRGEAAKRRGPGGDGQGPGRESGPRIRRPGADQRRPPASARKTSALERQAKTKKKGARKSRPRGPKKQEDDSSTRRNK